MKRRIGGLGIAIFSLFLLMGAACPKKAPKVATAPAEKVIGPGEKAGQAFQEAEALYSAGNYEAASKIYARIIADFPATEAARHSHFRLGQCYLKLGKDAEAMKEFQTYVETYRDDSEITLAQDYIIKMQENDIQSMRQNYESRLVGLENENYGLNLINGYLQRSIDSETIYVEIDLEDDRLFCKLGTQTLYEYPVISGKKGARVGGKYKEWATPPGIRRIQTMEKDPMWIRPDWVWLERGQRPPAGLTMAQRSVPKVLGPYKLTMGEGYAIHGTRAGTIQPGKFSHGCVRMNNKDLLQLVHLVEIGTMVYLY